MKSSYTDVIVTGAHHGVGITKEVGMAWGFRRSLRLGPVRLNFSKSGLGLSTGVRGLHVGTGPRGAYLRAGIPGTGIYYRKSLKGPKVAHTRAPAQKALQKPWVLAAAALLRNEPREALALLDQVKVNDGPAVHVEVDDDVVVSLYPDACGIAVMRAEAHERLGERDVALQLARAAEAQGCHVAHIVAEEIARGDT